jgi:uncharacterized SAM-binding protein YcdF (DUF218 family)
VSIALIYCIKLLVLPPASLIILALLGLLLHKRKQGFWVALTSLCLLLMLSLPVVVSQWARFWERFPPLEVSQIGLFKARAIVVIGGGAVLHADEYRSLQTVNYRTLLRIRYAAKLARELDLPILVSGGNVMGTEYFSEAQLMADVLEQEFNTPVAWLESKSRNTAENAQFTGRMLREFDINRILLITQAYHMPRAVLEFRKAGFEVLPAPTAFIGGHSEMTVLDFLPSAATLMNSFLLAHEGLGVLWFYFK